MPHQCTGCGHTFEDGSKEMLSGCPECGGNKFQFRPAGDPTDSSTDEAERSADGTDAAAGASEPPADDTAPAPDPPDRPDRAGSSVAETVGRATTKVRDFVSSEPTPPEPDAEWPDDWESSAGGPAGEVPSGSDVAASGSENDDIIDADARRAASQGPDDPKESAAQASARTDVVSSDELEDTAVENKLDDTVVVDDESDAPSGRSHAPDSSDPSTTDSVPDGEIVSEPTDQEPDLAELREQLNDQFESIKILEPGQYELNLMELYDREEYIIALQENGRYVIQVPDQWIGEDLDDR